MSREPAPLTSRHFQRAARQRLATATFLFQNDYRLDAAYLAGYAIECALKALILEATPPEERDAMRERITRGRAMHDPETLGRILRESDRPIPAELIKRLRRTLEISPHGRIIDLRYESGRVDAGEARGLLKTAKATLDWVEGQLP